MNDGDLRSSMSRNFSEEYPFSQFTTAIFRTTDVIVDARVRKTRFGFWEEAALKTYEGSEKVER